MAILAIMLWPGDADTLEACITHDLGEYASGDIPWGGDKTTADTVADKWSKLHNLDMHLDMSPVKSARVKFLDRADAYLWAMHHNPRLGKRKDWKDQKKWLSSEAQQLGVSDQWTAMLNSL